ncbi:MAG: LON peptidase substrate-binding domain-containing protein [Nitrospirae bacterium]|nr:LON peptidase substrate-binding domain-containing protein [Nitrospirota bacterium]
MQSTIIPQILPLFPLPDVVLFPRIYLPLHIFEPRYRELVRDVRAGDPYIGMALLKEGWESDYRGNPPIYPVGCAGRIVEVESLPDGKYNLVLHGLRRIRMLEEFHDRSYRQAWVEVLEEPDVALPPPLREAFFRVLEEYAALSGNRKVMDRILKANLEERVLVHTLSFGLGFTPLEKQFLLEAEGLNQQCKRLIDLLQFQIAERRARLGKLTQ